MTNSSHRPYASTILYIVSQPSTYNAIPVNIRHRKEVLEHLGYTVYVVVYPQTSLSDILRQTWRLRHALVATLLRIDGTGVLDNFTILKFFLPTVPLLWEIHGFPVERFAFSRTLPDKWFVYKNTLKRRMLSFFVDACIFISPQLKKYAADKIHCRHKVVIPNWVDINDQALNHTRNISPSFLLQNKFIVLWGGDSRLPWQATDVVQRTAQRIYAEDKRILFLLVGSTYWHTIEPGPNCLCIKSMTHDHFLNVVKTSHLCLALYHHLRYFPFYFCSMKILEYIRMGKPVIATDIGMNSSFIQDGKTGFLTDNSVDDICKKILFLKHNRAFAKKISLRARETAIKKWNEKTPRLHYKQLLESL